MSLCFCEKRVRYLEAYYDSVVTISRASLCHRLPAALLLTGLPLQLNSFPILLTRQLPGWLSQCNARVLSYSKTGLTGAPESALFIYKYIYKYNITIFCLDIKFLPYL